MTTTEVKQLAAFYKFPKIMYDGEEAVATLIKFAEIILAKERARPKQDIDRFSGGL